MPRLFKEFNEEKWEQIRNHPYYAPAVAAIRERTEEMLRTEPLRVKFSEIHLFATTGNRKIFERVYEDYRDRLNNYLFMYCLTKKQKYLDAYVDILWNICDFESWSIPAHVGEELTPQMRRVNLDLCSTIMGFRIAEGLYFIGDQLPELVRKRALYEVRHRVIESYAQNEYWWMNCTNNWAAVCIAAVLATYLYAATEEEIQAQLPRMIATMNCYLQGFDEEGCCLEGYGYWNYGFSHCCLFASLLREYTEGKMDLFADPKVRAIAHFQENIAINEHQCISFSDCGSEFRPNDWLTHFLKKEYPDLATPDFAQATADVGVLRYLLWSDPELAKGGFTPASAMFARNQWYIYRSESYNMACKAGCNEEPHNHNDVGSFLISKNNRVTFTDPGGGEYSRQYFSEERYSILEPSSRSHSVPIINGKYQVAGAAKAKVYCAKEGYYAFSMENAYDIPQLKSLKREFVCEEDRILLTDSYLFEEVPESVIERYVSLEEPHLTEKGVLCGDSLLVFDPSVVKVTLGSERRMRGGKEAEPVYFTDLEALCPKKELVLQVEFR